MMYKLFTSPSARLSHQVAIKKNMGISPEVEGWHSWSTHIHKGILNVALIEARYKVHARWHLVPERLSRMYSGSSASCFRGCGQMDGGLASKFIALG